MMQLRDLTAFSVLGANALPLAGVVALGWDAAAVLTVYAAEVLATFLAYALVVPFARVETPAEGDPSADGRAADGGRGGDSGRGGPLVPTPSYSIPFVGDRVVRLPALGRLDGRALSYAVALVLWGIVAGIGLSQLVVGVGSLRLPDPAGGSLGAPASEVYATTATTLSRVASPALLTVGAALVVARALVLRAEFGAGDARPRAAVLARTPYRLALTVAGLFGAAVVGSLLVVWPVAVLAGDALGTTAAAALVDRGDAAILCCGKVAVEAHRLRTAG